jgi:hypothetical protein
MKKTILFILIILMLLPNILALDCPRGEVNDTYPGDCGLYSDSNKDTICDYSENSLTNPIPNTIIDAKTNTLANLSQEKITKDYHFIPILIISIILYLISYFLARFNKISQVFHKKIWNLILLIGFLGAGLSGLFLVLNLEYGINITWPFSLIFWHVETGIVMTLISFFHIIWHWNYFKSYIKKKLSV